jgi:ribosomal protein S18 acetylase RimI-like enzyme
MMEVSRQPAFQIRPFEPEDYPAVQQIWQDTGMADPRRKDGLEVILNTLRKGGIVMVMERKDTKDMIGTAWITNNGRRLYLHHFGIRPEYQGRGLGYQLGLACMAFAREKKMQIKLEVHSTNTSARRLYKKLGFEVLEGYEVHIHRKP